MSRSLLVDSLHLLVTSFGGIRNVLSWSHKRWRIFPCFCKAGCAMASLLHYEFICKMLVALELSVKQKTKGHTFGGPACERRTVPIIPLKISKGHTKWLYALPISHNRPSRGEPLCGPIVGFNARANNTTVGKTFGAIQIFLAWGQLCLK